MQKYRIIFFVLSIIISLIYPMKIYAEYIGGYGDGWDYTTVTTIMYNGGSGDGHSMVGMSSDIGVGYGTPAKLGFITQPGNSFAMQALITMPVVAIQDDFSNTVQNATNAVTLTAQGGGGGTVYNSNGTVPVTKLAINGLANWTGSGIFVDLGGNGYTLIATSNTLTSAVSNSFNISTPPSSSDLSCSLAADGTGDVTATYTAMSNESNACNFTTDPSQVQYSFDNVSWNNATVSGTTSGITASPTGVVHSDLIWESKTDADNTEDSSVYFRIKVHDGVGYQAAYTNVTSPFLVDTKIPTNVSLSAPSDGEINVSLVPTFTATIANDLSSKQYYFQVASNFVFSVGLQSSGWQAGTSWTLLDALDTNTVYYARVKVRDAYNNESSYCGATPDTLGYISFTTTPIGNAPPTVSSISGSELTNGSKRVLATYTVADDESNNCNFTRDANQAQYSANGSTWSNATISGTTSGITTSPSGVTHNAGNQPLYWEAGTDLNNTEDNTVYFRIRLHDGYHYQASYATTAAFPLDTRAPVVSSATAFTASPVAGDTSITLHSSWSESNPASSLFYYALDGTTYSSGLAGTPSTTNPTVTINLGATLNGHSYFDKIRSTLTDTYGNTSSASEDLTDVGVKPYRPAAPTVQNPTYTSLDVIINKNPVEADDVPYCIYASPDVNGNNYVQSDGSVGASPTWQTSAVWGTVAVIGLSDGAVYTFKTKSRNPHVTSVESDWSVTTAGITQLAGVETLPRVNYAYDPAADSLGFQVWLERAGLIVVTPAGNAASVDIFDSSNNKMNPDPISSSVPDSRGVWWLLWDPAAGTGLAQNTNYLAKVSIAYQGVTYTTSVLVNITTAKTISDIQASVGTGLAATVSDIQTSVGENLGVKVDSLQAAVGAAEPTTLSSRVTSILEDTGTNIPAIIASEIKKGTGSKILNRPTTVNTGETVAIRYKTDSGLASTTTIMLYDPNNVVRIPTTNMTEIDSSGIYEYKITFQEAWGTGDYTVLCAESQTGSADSMVLSVGTAISLSGIASRIEGLDSDLTGISGNVSNVQKIVGSTTDTANADTLYGKLTGVSANAEEAVADWGKYTAEDVVKYVNNVEESMGTPNDTSAKRTVFGKMSEIYSQTGQIPAAAKNASSAYDYVQKLRKEIDFNGKTDTAYVLMKDINRIVKEIKGGLLGMPDEAAEATALEMQSSIAQTGKMITEKAIKAGYKGAMAHGLKEVPATLDNLQNQVSELKAMLEVIKKSSEQKDVVVQTWLESGSVHLKAVAANPSDTEKKTMPVKVDLPKGVSPSDIVDNGGFEIGYDFEKSVYYAYQEVTLDPKETQILSIVMNDIWAVPEAELATLREYVKKVMEVLSNTKYYSQAKILSGNILDRINKIKEQQGMEGVAVEKRLSNYEVNSAVLKDIKRDVGAIVDLAMELGWVPDAGVIDESSITTEPAHVETPKLDKEKMGTVKFKIKASNSSSEKKIMPLKYYFPGEVKPEYIVDNGGLEITYDYQKGLQYAYGELDLEAGEARDFVVTVNDVWVIPEEQIRILKGHAEKLISLIKGSPYEGPAKYLGNRILLDLDNILTVQSNPDTNIERRIGTYRANLERFDTASRDVAKLEKLVISAGGSPGFTIGTKDVQVRREGSMAPTKKAEQIMVRGAKGLKIVSQTMFAGKAPDTGTTWRVIWIIIGFLATVSFLFFILWWTQIKSKAGKKETRISGEQKEEKKI